MTTGDEMAQTEGVRKRKSIIIISFGQFFMDILARKIVWPKNSDAPRLPPLIER